MNRTGSGNGWCINGSGFGIHRRLPYRDATIIDCVLLLLTFPPSLSPSSLFQGEMDKICIMPGVWDSDFIGESQHNTATHYVDPSLSALRKLNILRGNIRAFKMENNINGHTTVIWSASVERNSEREFETMEELLEAIKANDSEV